MLLRLSMTLEYIRLPDGRTVNARSDRQLLLDVLEAILTGQMKVHMSDIKTIAQWTFKTKRAKMAADHFERM